MKKIFSMIVAAALVLPMVAQEQDASNKFDKSEYLPVEGDWSVGFTLNPFVTFVGNMFNANTYNTLDERKIGGGILYRNDQASYPLVSVMGKYMLTDDWGIRANIGFLLQYDDSVKHVVDDLSAAQGDLIPAMVKDRRISRTYGGTLAVGAEYHLGHKHAVQGIFSASLMYSLASHDSRFTYGNAMTDVNQNPTSGFKSSLFGENKLGMPYYRVLREDAHYTHTIGLVGGVGFEWFVAPKIAFGAEVNLALLYRISPSVKQQIEGYVEMVDEVKTATVVVGDSYRGLVFGTQNIGANLFMSFYF